MLAKPSNKDVLMVILGQIAILIVFFLAIQIYNFISMSLRDPYVAWNQLMIQAKDIHENSYSHYSFKRIKTSSEDLQPDLEGIDFAVSFDFINELGSGDTVEFASLYTSESSVTGRFQRIEEVPDATTSMPFQPVDTISYISITEAISRTYSQASSIADQEALQLREVSGTLLIGDPHTIPALWIIHYPDNTPSDGIPDDEFYSILISLDAVTGEIIRSQICTLSNEGSKCAVR
jgi:hypothetical protein